MGIENQEGRASVRPSCVQTINTEEELQECVSHFLDQPAFVLDVETIGKHRGDPLRNEVLWIVLADDYRVDVIPMGHPNGDLIRYDYPLLSSGIKRQEEGLPLRKSDYSKAESKRIPVFTDPPEQLLPATVFEAIRPLLFGDKVVVGHNVKFDLRSVAKYYGEIPTTDLFDTVIGEFICNDLLQHKLGLDACVRRRFDYPMVKGVGKEIEKYSYRFAARYVYLDGYWTWKLYKDETERLRTHQLTHIAKLEFDLAKVIMDMEQVGTLIDTDSLEVLKKELEEGITQATAEAYKAAGHPFSVTSNAEIQKVIYQEQGMVPHVLTAKKEEPATSDEALKHYPKNKTAQQILIIRELKKLLSTYVIPYLGGEVERTVGGKTKVEYKEPLLVNGRVHTNYKQHGARTGRLSSANPNLQNIPNPEKSDYGRRIRDAFIADPGHILVQADWAQIEPRIMASLSKDKTMTDAFLNGEDVYTALSDPLGFERSAGKMLILAMAYGIGPKSIAERLGISVVQAKKLLRDFEKQHPEMMRHQAQVIRNASVRRPVPYSTTVLGRRRFIPELLSRDKRERSEGERRAYNHLIQGTASELMKIALIKIHRALRDIPAQILLTVHDEVVVSAESGVADEVADLVKNNMESINLPGINVPLVAEVKTVTSWGQAK